MEREFSFSKGDVGRSLTPIFCKMTLKDEIGLEYNQVSDERKAIKASLFSYL
jgi:hypothetical protein